MAIYLIVLTCVLTHAGFGGAKVALPLHALSLGVDPFSVGVIMALWALCPMLIALYVGRLVDRSGKAVRTAPRDALIRDSTPASPPATIRS